MLSVCAIIGLLQAVDTVVTLQARDGLGTAAALADIGLAAAVAVILLGLVVLLLQLRGIYATVRELTGRVQKGLDPMFDQGREAAANIEFITSALRTDTQQLSDSVRLLSERLQSASDRMERRVQEFDALMEVVQSEAEDLFIASAAAARGVRAGARSLRDGGLGPGLADAGSGAGVEDNGPAGTGESGPVPLSTPVHATSRGEAAPGRGQATGTGEDEGGRRSGSA